MLGARLPIMATCVSLTLGLSGCGDGEPASPAPPTYQSCRATGKGMGICGTGMSDREGLLGGPSSPDYDAVLAEKARRFDRLFYALNSYSTGVNTELTVADGANQASVAAFATMDDGWDFATFGGLAPEAVGSWSKAAGAYAGVGVAADAFRYGTLRDQGGDCMELELAKKQFQRGLDALHLATAITGVEGVIARGFARTDQPGTGQSMMTTPLFDGNGNPLPLQKDNGTWRDDQSGEYPNYIWEDSCSRDQLVGWAMGYAAAWEVIASDPAFSDADKARLQKDATAIAKSLMKVGDQGYDLEIHDADGRLAYFGYLNENTLDTGYLKGIRNGFMSLLAFGIVTAFASVAEDPYVYQYLYEELWDKRRLPEIARDNMVFVDTGPASNFSNYNMAFLGGLLAHRYHCDPEVRATVDQAIDTSLYDNGGDRQPREQKQTLFDFTYVLAKAGSTAYQAMQSAPDVAAFQSGIDTLNEFAEPPFWNVTRTNCDDMEIMSGQCIGDDGTPITLLGPVGHNSELVSAAPIPMHLRPPSNYFWRSNPYAVNGTGDGTLLLPGVDFRFAYWLARFSR